MDLNLSFFHNLSRPKKISFLLVSIFFIVSGVLLANKLGFINFLRRGIISQERNWKYELSDASPQYTEASSLVSKTVSKSANIVINLPEEISPETAKATIKFTPVVAGEWSEQKAEKKLIFNPTKELKVGNYYTVTIPYNEGTIGGDFLVEDNPEVLSVFPKADSETDEKSEITILFNRPMVPLSSLDIMAPEGVPVEVTPATKGKFKWIGTRSLQFIPDNNLIRSSNYSVKIKPEFQSMDGLGIPEFKHSFATRKLRYDNLTLDNLVYNQPVAIVFNQEVNLERSKERISLKDEIKNEKIDFIVEYGKREVYDEKLKNYQTVEDKSILWVYNKKDKFGREKYWDFEGKYLFEIAGAIPSEGDITLQESRQQAYTVSGIIQSVSAESEQSTWVNKDFFDATGKLIVEFYEEIDLQKSEIKNEKILTKVYGQKCVDSDADFYMGDDSECEKEVDKTKIEFTFDKQNIHRGDKLLLVFEKIVNMDGQTVNNKKEEEQIKVIPEFKILSFVPSNKSNSASLTNLIICTNSPVNTPDKEDIGQYLVANKPYESGAWYPPTLVPDYEDSYYKCKAGEFQNDINYGLMPNENYELKIKLEDNFGGLANQILVFKTESMPEHFLNFYHLQEKVLLTTPEKTKLTFATENMEFVDLNICKLPAEDMMRYVMNQPEYYNGPETIKNCLEKKDVKISLEKKYWIKNYFQMDLSKYIDKPFGHYLLTFSNPSYKDQSVEKRKVFERVYLSVTKLGIIEKKIDIGVIENKDPGAGIDNLFWVTDLKTMSAIGGAEVKIFEETPESAVIEKEKTLTDASGIARISAKGESDALLVTKDNDSAFLINEENNLESGSWAYSAKNIYLYTDRPIYRPGHEVGVKGIYRVGYDNDYEIFSEEKVHVSVVNSLQEEIYKDDVAVNDFGTFNFKFTLPENSPLGGYYISTEGGMATFDVEEYVPSAFKVDLKSDQEEYVSGDTLNLDIEASYYFGAPVDEGEVEYSIGSQDYYFDRYDDGTFNFGAGWYYCYWGCSYNDKFILRNVTKLNADGRGSISQKLDLRVLFKDETDSSSKIFVLYATVKNKNGQSVSSQKSFIVHRGEHYLGLKTDKSFLAANEKFNVQLKTVDPKGESLSVDKIDLSINLITWERVKRKQVDGAYYYQWEEKLKPIITDSVSTNKKGDFSKQYQLKDDGQYRIVAKSQDSRANVISSTYDLYVYGSGEASVKPNNDHTLEIEANSRELNVGETGEIIIKSPFKKAKALISIERGRIFKYEIVPVEQSLFNYKFKIEDDYIPNVYVSVTLISDGPDIKYGSSQFRVNIKEKKIEVDLKTDKDHYLPGEEVEISVNARDSKGQPVETEFSLAVADLSVLALKGNPKKNPLVFFYSGFPLTVTTASNYKNILFEMDVPVGTKGGGGSEPEDLAKKKRGEFKDTALWEATVKTDSQGKATVSFTLPDNLTTWQVEALGVTKDTKLGIAYSEFMAKKDVMLVPLQPRFIVPGDEFAIGAKVFNQTDKPQELKVSFLNGNLEVIGETEATIVIPAKNNDIVYFRAKAPVKNEKGSYNYTLSAVNSRYEDTVESSLKIRPNDTYETTATAGYSKENELNEYVYLPNNVLPDKGGLTINTSATLAVFLSKALNSLVNYPYGCGEQITSKLDAIAIIKRGLNLENVGDKFKLDEIKYNNRVYTLDELVEIGLKDLYKNQTPEGGFTYYPNSGNADFYLSLHVADTLYSLEGAGYKIDEERTRKVYSYIQDTLLNSQNNWLQTDENYIYAGLTLSKLSKYGSFNVTLKNKIKAIKSKDKYINESISSLALVNLAMLISNNPRDYDADFLTKVLTNLENRIEIDSRGAFLPSNDSWSWYNYETPINNTSRLLKVLVKNKRDNELLDRVMRWMLRSRYKDGAWGSTNNTLNAIDAFVDYLVWQEENKSNFSLSINLNQTELAKTVYGPENIFEQSNLSLGISELGIDKLNKINFSKTNLNQLNNNYYYDMSLKYYLPAQSIPPRDEGFTVERNFYRVSDKEMKEAVQEAQVGDVLKGHIKIRLAKDKHFVSVEDFIPAGVEIINFNLATENVSAIVDNGSMGNEIPDINNQDGYNYSRWYMDWENQRKLYPSFQESHDDRLFLFVENLAPGEYEYDYYVRALVPGKFQWLPAQAQEMYFPENFGRTGGRMFVVNVKE